MGTEANCSPETTHGMIARCSPSRAGANHCRFQQLQ